jgi:uracil-DNA glycosylase
MKKVALIGQAPPKVDPERPFGRTKLYPWLNSVGIDFDIIDKYFIFSAVIDYFPGLNKNKGHAVPTPDQIRESRPRLKKLLLDFNPDIVVPIGKLSISECLGEEVVLEDVIGKEFLNDPYNVFGIKKIIIPLPHPSGASTWIYQKENSKLLNEALNLLKKQISSS